MTQPKISLHDALKAIHEHLKISGKNKLTIAVPKESSSPFVWVGYKERHLVCNPDWEPGLYERELGFPAFISDEPEKVEEVQKEETKVKKFVVFDDKGGWSTTVSALTLEKALELVTEDSEGDYAWENGCSVNVGEVVFEGKIKSVAVQNVVEDLCTEEEVETEKELPLKKIGTFPVGTILRAKIDHPMCSDVLKGELAIVTSQEGIGGSRARKLNGGDWYFLYGTSKTLKDFSEMWEVVKDADTISDKEEIGHLPKGTILEALVDYPYYIYSPEVVRLVG
jgi:hypothetical protein